MPLRASECHGSGPGWTVTGRSGWPPRGYGYPIPPIWHAESDRKLTDLRKALEEERFSVLWAEGRAVSLDQAVECALSVDR